MDLAGALDVGDRALVAFVGAGGKKTAMARLVDEGTADGLAVGYTTTTHVPPPDLPLAVCEPETLERSLEAHEPPVAVAREWVDEPERADEKLRGFSPAVVDWLHRTRRFDWLLVKADGARRRGFKAPGPDEPALPDLTSHLVAVVSSRTVGRPLGAAHVHRPERVAALTGLALDDELTPEAVGSVLASPEGGLKDVPPDASVAFVLNQADTPELAARARAVVDHALAAVDRPVRAVVTSFRTGRCELVAPGEVS